MEIYCVGGSIRDILLDLPVHDNDYVVIGSNHTEMINQRFTVVGSGFPVYLHPITGDEYALGRTETKIGVGYTGFATETENVTLQDDLSRRDLCCNALAVRVEDWDKFIETKDESLVIDYFGGIGDLKTGVLRHINEDFALDPVRILRVSRFSARYGFDVHPDTIELMSQIVPELSTVPQERIWAEFEKGLNEKDPVKMFTVLVECGALNEDGPLAPYAHCDALTLNRVAKCAGDLTTRFVFVSKGFVLSDYERCRIPTELTLVSYMFNSFKQSLMDYKHYSKEERLNVLDKMRAFSRPWLLDKCLYALSFCGQYIKVMETINKIRLDVETTKAVPAAEIAATAKNGKEIKEKIFAARIAVMK